MLTIFLFIAMLFSLLILVVVVTEMLVFVKTHVPFVPSPEQDIHLLVKRLPVTETDFVFDLGSGNGKVVFTIEKLSGARVKGFQLRGWTHWYAQLRKKWMRSNAELVGGDFFKHHWGEATIVYAYLYPFLMHSIGEKAMADCKPGTRIIARDFPIPNLNLVEYWDLGKGHEMFIYQV